MKLEKFFLKNFLIYIAVEILVIVIFFSIFGYISLRNAKSEAKEYSKNIIVGVSKLLNNVMGDFNWYVERQLKITIDNIKRNPESFEEHLNYFFAIAPHNFPESHLKILSFNELPEGVRNKLIKDEVSYFIVRNVEDKTLKNDVYIRVNDTVFVIEEKFPLTFLNNSISNFISIVENAEFVESFALYTHNGELLLTSNEDVQKTIDVKGLEIGKLYVVDKTITKEEIYYSWKVESDYESFGPIFLKISVNYFGIVKNMLISAFASLIIIFGIGVPIILFGAQKVSRKVSSKIEQLINNMKNFREKRIFNNENFELVNIDEINALTKEYQYMAEELTAYLEELTAMNEELEKNYEELEILNEELEKSYIEFSKRFAKVAEGYDENTGNHIERVGILSAFIARKMGLQEDIVYKIRHYAALHDIGKIFIPREILLKKGKLTDDEWKEMKKHTTYGARLIGDNPFLEIARNIALYHHENFDGSGYPYGLESSEIPIEAMIVHIVDVYDALRSKRSYKLAFSHEKAMKIILEGDGRTKPSHFAPEVLEIFRKHEKEIKELWEHIYID